MGGFGSREGLDPVGGHPEFDRFRRHVGANQGFVERCGGDHADAAFTVRWFAQHEFAIESKHGQNALTIVLYGQYKLLTDDYHCLRKPI
jgi:hypothetical protein